MIPVNIPPEFIVDGAESIHIAVSEDQLARGIQPLVAIRDTIVGGPNDGMPRLLIRLKLEPGELEALHDNPHVWLSFFTHGSIYPFMVAAEEIATVEVEATEPNESVQAMMAMNLEEIEKLYGGKYAQEIYDKADALCTAGLHPYFGDNPHGGQCQCGEREYVLRGPNGDGKPDIE